MTSTRSSNVSSGTYITCRARKVPEEVNHIRKSFCDRLTRTRPGVGHVYFTRRQRFVVE